MQAEVLIVIKKKRKKHLVTRNTSLVLKSGEEWVAVGLQRCEVRVGKKNFLQELISSETI